MDLWICNNEHLYALVNATAEILKNIFFSKKNELLKLDVREVLPSGTIWMRRVKGTT